MELNATSVAAANILSLISLIGDSSVASTRQSAAFPQAFSALLTEMMGPTAAQISLPSAAQPVQVGTPSVSVDVPVSASSLNDPMAADPTIVVASEPSVENGADLGKTAAPTVNEGASLADSTKADRSQTAPTIAGLVQDRLEPKVATTQEPVQTAKSALSTMAESVETPSLSPDPIPDAPVLNAVPTGETSKTVVPENPVSGTKATQASNIVVPPVSFLYFAVSPLTFAPAVADSKTANLDPPLAEPVPVFQAAHPELDRAFADVKNFELTVQPDVSKTSTVPVGHSASLPEDQSSKMAIVTTDPVRNLTQQQLPPRIVPVLKVLPEAKAADRSKLSATLEKDVIAPFSAQFTDLVRPVDQVDQAPAAHTIEIPNIPHLPVVRIVAMQIGEAGSEVTVRIQQRDGNLTLQLNSDNDRLQQNLQSSVGSLAQALKQENLPVSAIEVSRKSLTDRVRRMKETH